MQVDFDASELIANITEEISRIPAELESQKKPLLQKISKIIKANVVKNLPKSDLDATDTNYDGTPYVHMKDDVKTQIVDDKAGNIYTVIKGGKYTGYKWHMLNNGTSKTRATHFADKAMQESEQDINQAIDEVIGRAVQVGG